MCNEFECSIAACIFQGCRDGKPSLKKLDCCRRALIFMSDPTSYVPLMSYSYEIAEVLPITTWQISLACNYVNLTTPIPTQLCTSIFFLWNSANCNYYSCNIKKNENWRKFLANFDNTQYPCNFHYFDPCTHCSKTPTSSNYD